MGVVGVVTLTSGYSSAKHLSTSAPTLTSGYAPHVGISSYTAGPSLSGYSTPNLRMVRSSEWTTT